MKKPYSITAAFTTGQPQPIDLSTDLDTQRKTHAAGIPEFQLRQTEIIMLEISFVSDPDPIDPTLPHTNAQNAALRQIKAEISQKYGPQKTIKFKLQPT